MNATIRRIQKKLSLPPDGRLTPGLLNAIAHALNLSAEPPPLWPTSEAIRRGISCFGSPGNEGALIHLIPPYPLYRRGRRLPALRVHEKIAPHVLRALHDIRDHYGEERIHQLELDQCGDDYSYRLTADGRQLSLHAWGIALDFSPSANAPRLKAPRARLSCPEYRDWWDIWESHGALSRGRRTGSGWMHLQFTQTP